MKGVTETVILAAGESMGFWPTSLSKPKTLIEIDKKPLLYHQLDWLCQWGINRVIIALQRKHYDATYTALKDGVPYPVSVELVCDEEPPGSAGSARSALNYIKNEEFLVINCDDITDVDIGALCRVGSPAISITPYRLRFGLVEVEPENNVVKSFGEKPMLKEYTSCGWYLMSKAVEFPERGSFEYDVFPKLVQAGTLKAYKHNGMWWTVNNWREKHELEKVWAGKGPRW